MSKQDDLLDTLLSSYSTTSASNSVNGPGIGPEKKKEYGYQDFENLLESTPIFMNQTPKDGETNDVLEALRTLVFEGEGDDVATNFKNHGNELHLQKSYSEAIKAYTQGLDSHPKDLKLKITLLNNRAQSNLLLKNHSSVLKDVGTIIALYTAEKLPSDKALIKAMYRVTNSLIALERWREALDVISRAKGELQNGKIPGEDISLWDGLEEKVQKGQQREVERANRIRREKITKITLEKAVIQRGLINVKTPSPPDNSPPVLFDPSEYDQSNYAETLSPETPLIFPVFLLYPQYGQSDFITAFQENTSFIDQLNMMFPQSPTQVNIPPAKWDEKKEYYVDNLVIYVETREKRLLKVGKELTLREIIRKAQRGEDKEKGLTKDGVVLKDGLLSFVVLPKGEVEKRWIDEFKKSRDGK
ncbi:hypothetical protein I302_101978 [Kwoniella bestiolae CBS 10118]|uniref:Cns1/TTC4 wheel domain-containing protein n=1 Tax=Kwoniella bestiolae CBS 10118 TaxID=1296100 RepID=A0A1B9GDS7_9TREE|nr:hypothetical protein I302_00662 [Kwoniella bestiolae CBS 10118]OCF29166.1 hypothetical protein I302_00662 [Kwoniella bestiolae CBS 10118]